jgi:N-acetylneuraminic acid mutarotase
MLNSKAWVCNILLALLLASCFFDVATSASVSISENTWEAKAPIPVPDGVKEAAAVNEKIYVIGGSINYEYDPATNSWTAKAPMPTSRWHFGIAVYEKKIYTFGGWDATETEIYDPETNTWQTKTPLPSSEINPQANVVNDKIYVMSMNGSYCYNIANDSWSTKSNAPQGSSQTAVDGKIYRFSNNYTGIYDPETDSWSEGASMPIPLTSQSVCATTGIMSPKRIYLFGGIPQLFDFGTNSTQVYDPKTDNWTLGKPMPTARFGATVAAVDDRVYVIGGTTGMYSVTDANEEYTPFGYGTPDPSYDPTNSQESFSTSLVVAVASGVLIAAVAAGVLIYWKKRKR